MRKLRIVFVAAVVMAMVTTACSSDDTNNQAASGDAGIGSAAPSTDVVQIRQGGSASVIVSNDAATVDPVTTINNATQGSTLLNAIFDVLFTVDEHGVLQPRLATAFATDDGVTWTMTLREGVTFTDGTLLDADAVLAHWQEVKGNPRAGSSFSVLNHGVASMTVVDPLTFQVVLTAPNRQFHHVVAAGNLVWIPSPSAKAAAGDNFAQNPVGAGPFTIKSRTQGIETVLERNPTFWEQGYPKLDTLTLKVIGDEQQAIDTFDTGGAEVTFQYRRGLAEENGLRIESIPVVGASGWLFGTKAGPFTDVRARKAVYLALDMQRLNRNVYQDNETVATSLFPEGSPFHNPDLAFPEPDPVEAQRLFDELAAEGKRVEFTIIGTPGNQPQLVELQTQLQAFDNVDASVSQVDGATYGISLYSGDFEMAVYALSGLDPEPAFQGLRSGWPVPIASLDNPVVDAALDQGRQTLDQDERQAAYDQLARELNEQFRIKWMIENAVFITMTNDVAGIELYGAGTALVHGLGHVE